MNRLVFFLISYTIFSISCFGQERFSVEVNDQLLSQENFSHQVFCLNKLDTFSIEYIYTGQVDSLQHLITSIELWVQYELGKPVFIGALKQEKASSVGRIKFRLIDFEIGKKIPQTPKVLRSSFLIRNVLSVTGNRVVETYVPSQNDGSINFMIMPHCPQ